MASVNKAIIVGRLGKDPEVKRTAGGTAVANFSVATDFHWTDKGGQRQEKTEWHRIVVWGKSAENCERYLGKGRLVYVEGRIETREWQDKDGGRRFTTEIVADVVNFLDKAENAGGGGHQERGGGRPAQAPAGVPQGGDFGDGDIPF